MSVVHDRSRLKADAVAPPGEPGENQQVLSTAGIGAGSEREVKAAELAQRPGSECHVRAGAEASGGVQREAPSHESVLAERIDGCRT